jgi:hypothetical protein
MAACRPQNRSNREYQKSSGHIAQRYPHTKSFIEIAPAVTKRALLTDNDDGHHVIAIAHQRRAKNEWCHQKVLLKSFPMNRASDRGHICIFYTN